MKISGLQKLTLLDYPGVVSCIIFTQGCNFKCSYCHNSELIKTNLKCPSLISEEEILAFLEERKNVLEGVVITGGEPTIQKDLVQFIKRVKALGYLIKLDTNGSHPEVLKELIQENLIDYIAMDIKAPPNSYDNITCIKTNIKAISRSINIIKKSNIKREFRTTIIKDMHNIKQIMDICSRIGSKEKLYLQNFEMSNNVINKKLLPFDKKELITIQYLIKKMYPNAIVRGI